MIKINGKNLGLNELIKVARNEDYIILDYEAKERVKNSRGIVEKIEEDKRVVYGITTGFGKFANVTISTER